MAISPSLRHALGLRPRAHAGLMLDAMAREHEQRTNPNDGLTRRDFMKTTSMGLAAAAGGGYVASSASGTSAAPSSSVASHPAVVEELDTLPQDRTWGEGPFGYDLPYTSQRMPVLARNCVATSQPLAAQAGLEMLRLGGNAADAAVATAAALTVVAPTANGIGGDNFALLWMKDEAGNAKLHGLNASGRAPKALDREAYAGLDSMPLYDWRAVTTPGAVAGWVATIERFGSLPLETVLAPAIRYAREGYLVSPGVARGWSASARRYRGQPRFEGWQQTFAPGGDAPQPGALYASTGHAKTLELIASTNGRAFYEGEIAEAIDAESRKFDGALRLADLRDHKAEWVDPISIDYKGWRLHEIPPNGQGITALLALGMLRRFDLAGMDVDSARWMHLQIEAMKLAFADAHQHIADPAHMRVSVEDLLSDGYLDERSKLIDPDTASTASYGEPKAGGTVLLTTADAQGNMVSFIQSNYTGFGSGMVVPGYGVAMHNRGGNFSLEPGHANEIAPGKLPYHTIIPGFVTHEGKPGMAFGVMGGFMQPQGHAQVVVRMGDHGQNPQAALDAPRWQVERNGRVMIEPGFETLADASVYDELEAMGHALRRRGSRSAQFGRGQIIYRLEDGYIAASDLRADGQAVGF
ncbi:MAG: gamma-glutamyltransferase family protein [Phycisphaerales bacterium]